MHNMCLFLDKTVHWNTIAIPHSQITSYIQWTQNGWTYLVYENVQERSILERSHLFLKVENYIVVLDTDLALAIIVFMLFPALWGQ